MNDTSAKHRDRSLATKDVEAAISIVSSVCDPQSSATVSERRSELCRRLAECVGADVWFGCVGVAKEQDHSDAPNFTAYDGGWVDEQERLRFYRITQDRRFNGVVNEVTARVFEGDGALTYRRHDAIPSKKWLESPASKVWNEAGFDHFIVTIYPLPNHYFSALGIHRRLGRPAFTSRDRTFVHVVWTQTQWLHQQEINFPAGHKVVELTLRERQVVLLMLGADSPAMVAKKLGLSEHTVGDHVKSIYRKLGVKSRPELVAQFIPS